MALVQFQADVPRRLILVTYEGIAAEHEHAEAIARVAQLVQPGQGVLVDMSRAIVNIPFSTNSKIATQRAAQNHPTAIVVADPISSGSANQFSHLVETRGGGEVAVFADLQEAYAWLEAKVSEMPSTKPSQITELKVGRARN